MVKTSKLNSTAYLLFFLTVTLSLPISADAEQKPIRMRVSHQLPSTHHLARLLEEWAARIEDGTGGAIDVQLFPSNQAFKVADNYPAVARGFIEAALTVSFQWCRTLPEMCVLARPYAFPDVKILRRFPRSALAQELSRMLESKGIHNLGWLSVNRTTVITSNQKLLIKPADFRGIKIRGVNKLFDQALIALGAAPSAIPGGELYLSLQTGILDAGLTDINNAYDYKYYEVQKYAVATPLFLIFEHIYVNPTWWKSLDQNSRLVIEQATRLLESEAIDKVIDISAKAPQRLRDKGMIVHEHTADEIEAMRKIMQPAFDRAFFSRTNTDINNYFKLLE
ncbi:MAG: C4-dicarboxylate ABC transporter [Gammaproteobacteria bacterium]|nr:C4-dicarboxylate ABC transporter [Gammaproteobacteria bacterium]